MRETFTLLPISLPLILVDALEITSEARYFSLHYMAPKPYWSDGRTGAMPSWAVYQKFTDHMAVAIYLSNYNLGYDDAEATYHLLYERVASKVYVGSASEVKQFLNAQHPPLPKVQINREQWSALKAELDRQMQIRDVKVRSKAESGELERSLHSTMQRESELIAQVEQWLDQQITEDLLRRYIQQASSGDLEAIAQLKKLQRRFRK